MNQVKPQGHRAEKGHGHPAKITINQNFLKKLYKIDGTYGMFEILTYFPTNSWHSRVSRPFWTFLSEPPDPCTYFLFGPLCLYHYRPDSTAHFGGIAGGGRDLPIPQFPSRASVFQILGYFLVGGSPNPPVHVCIRRHRRDGLSPCTLPSLWRSGTVKTFSIDGALMKDIKTIDVKDQFSLKFSYFPHFFRNAPL